MTLGEMTDADKVMNLQFSERSGRYPDPNDSSAFEHLYSPRMVEEIKEEKKMEHQTNKQ